MPGEKSKHISKWDRCVKKVKEKSPHINPYAICSSSIEDAGLKKKHQKRPKESYYSNRKRAKKKNESMIISFTDFILEDREWSQEDEVIFNKAKELINIFISENEPGDYSKEDIEDWLETKGELKSFASMIKSTLDNI